MKIEIQNKDKRGKTKQYYFESMETQLNYIVKTYIFW